MDPLTAADPESEDESDPEDVLLQALMGEDEYKDGVSDNGKDVEEFDDETLLNSDSKGLGLEVGDDGEEFKGATIVVAENATPAYV